MGFFSVFLRPFNKKALFLILSNCSPGASPNNLITRNEEYRLLINKVV